MLALVAVVTTLLGVPSVTSEGTGDSAPPAAQQSILPVHDVGLTFGLGVKIPDSGADPSGLLRLSVAWSPLDWLEISFPLPGAAVLLGTRNGDEVVLSACVDGVGYGSEEGLIIVPFVGAAYRHWFSSATSLGVTARWVGQYSKSPPQRELGGSVFVTHTFGEAVSLNFAVGAAGWPSGPSGLTFGSGRVGVRSLPLLRIQLNRVWSLDIDAQLLLRLQPTAATAQQYVLGFTGIW
ncbi:MAG: hypothetical protein ACXWLF_11850 [Myxococcaceae bacterium]